MTRTYSPLLFWLGMTIMASLMLYHTSDKVHALDVHLRKLNAQIETEQKSLHVLKAEWAYLTTPSRIEANARRHLRMSQTGPERVVSLENIGNILPMQKGTVDPVLAKNEAAGSTQIAATSNRPAMPVAKTEPAPRTKRDRVLAKLNSGRINDRMNMEHAMPVKASTDTIGALIGKLGLRQ